jgi:hypothetical protein
MIPGKRRLIPAATANLRSRAQSRARRARPVRSSRLGHISHTISKPNFPGKGEGLYGRCGRCVPLRDRPLLPRHAPARSAMRKRPAPRRRNPRWPDRKAKPPCASVAEMHRRAIAFCHSRLRPHSNPPRKRGGREGASGRASRPLVETCHVAMRRRVISCAFPAVAAVLSVHGQEPPV